VPETLTLFPAFCRMGAVVIDHKCSATMGHTQVTLVMAVKRRGNIAHKTRWLNVFDTWFSLSLSFRALIWSKLMPCQHLCRLQPTFRPLRPQVLLSLVPRLRFNIPPKVSISSFAIPITLDRHIIPCLMAMRKFFGLVVEFSGPDRKKWMVVSLFLPRLLG
jgi:hypothetical protein